MARQSRLRVSKGFSGRDLLLGIVVAGLLVAATYWAEKRYGLTDSLFELFAGAAATYSGATIERGAIYDRNLRQLAVTLERVAVFIRSREVKSISDTALSLADILAIDPNLLIDRLESGVLRFWVARDISQDQETAIKELNLPGVYFQKEEHRYYPQGKMAAHLLGYVEDGIGLSGVERYYDQLLASRRLQQEKDHQPISTAQELVLTIDLKIQKILESVVEQLYDPTSEGRAAAFLVESLSGQLIAGAQMPGFDPGNFTRFAREDITSMLFEPFLLPQRFRLFLRDCSELLAVGDDGEDTIPWSLASPAATLGLQLRLWQNLGLNETLPALTSFGVEEKGAGLAVDVGAAAARLDWELDMTPAWSTPYAQLKAMTELLHGPFQRPPYLVKKVLDLETGQEVDLTPVEQQDSGVGVQAASTENKRMLAANSYIGASGALYFSDEIISSFVVAKGVTRQRRNTITFVNIPAGEKDLTMIVVAQEEPFSPLPEKRRLLRVDKIIDERVARIRNLHQVATIVADVVEPEAVDEGNYQGQAYSPAKMVARESLQQVKMHTMPNLRGLSLRKSLRKLEGAGLTIRIRGTGRVVRQEPAAGTDLGTVEECYLILEDSEDMSLKEISKKVRTESN